MRTTLAALGLVVLLQGAAASQERFLRGDASADGGVDISDGIFLLRSLFLGGPHVACADAADANDSGGAPNVADAIFLFNFIFLGGAEPPPPFPACGADPTPDLAGCGAHPPCAERCAAGPDGPGPRLEGALEPLAGLAGGDVITLVGADFSAAPEDHRVLFAAGSAVAEGLALDVAFEGPGDGAGRRSELRVVVPTGVRTGTLELLVRGECAGTLAYTARPAILGFAVGDIWGGDEVCDLVHVVFPGILDFDTLSQPVVLRGINFGGVTRVVMVDDGGGSATFTGASFEALPAGPDGLERIEFSTGGVRMGLRGDRGSLRVHVAAGAARSNRAFLPLSTSMERPEWESIGPVIGEVLPPAGVVRGVVELGYLFHGTPADCAFPLVFEWSADGGTTWSPAAPAGGAGDAVVAASGTLVRRSADGACVPGDVRRFAWDPGEDERFAALAGTHHAVVFRVRAQPVPGDCLPDGPIGSLVLVESPPVAVAREPARF